MRIPIDHIIKYFIPKIVLYAVLVIYIYLFYKMTMQRGYYWGAMIASLPLLSITFFLLLKNPLWNFIVLFIINYFVMGINRYISFSPGIFMDVIIAFCFSALIIKSTYEKMEWKRILNPLTLTTTLWLLFCILELLNPKDVALDDWATKVRGLAIYPVLIVILVPVLLTRYKHLKGILIIWATLTLLAAFKGYWQKNHGFDATELEWLYVGGGARTHLISSGIRYFSFFTDAGNYGSCMGFSMVVLSISALYIKNNWLKFYFLIAALAGGYGMIISGTRGALAVPFIGYAIFALLSKNWKIALSSIILLITTFCFLNFTDIADENSLIRRMRSAFDKNDPSLNVRLENQKKLKEYLNDLPIGAGIGFSVTSKNDNNSDYELSQIPSDSWFVRVWIQTGIVGLTIYILLLFLAIIIGGYIILFKIKNKELGGILAAMLAGIFGMIASAYGNEILGQFPNCFLFYICLAFIFMGKYYDKELEEHEQLT